MKNILIAALLACVFSTSFAQKEIHDANAVVLNVKDYHSIAVSDGIDLFISHGEEVVAVSASEEKYRSRIRAVVDKGVLTIKYDDDSKLGWRGNKKLKAYVSYKNLYAISASGGSDVFIDGTVRSKDLVIKISGGSDLSGKVDVDDLRVMQSGGSDINISGRAVRVSIDASGGSDFNGFSLATDVCTIEASGASDVEVTVNKELTARASGASDISYKGDATVRESKSNGASSVRKS
jgi:ribosomal protein S6E (S10)